MKKLAKFVGAYLASGAVAAWSLGVGAYCEMDLDRAYPNKESMGKHATIGKALWCCVTWPWWLAKATYTAFKRVYDFMYK